jgi:hypothetical protein
VSPGIHLLVNSGYSFLNNTDVYVDADFVECHWSNKLQDESEENLESLQLYIDGCQDVLLQEVKDSLQDELIRYHLDAAMEFAVDHDVCGVYKCVGFGPC